MVTDVEEQVLKKCLLASQGYPESTCRTITFPSPLRPLGSLPNSTSRLRRRWSSSLQPKPRTRASRSLIPSPEPARPIRCQVRGLPATDQSERAPPPQPSANGRKPAGRAAEAHGPHELGGGGGGGGGDCGGPGENTTWRRAGRTELQRRSREGSEVSEGGKRCPSPRHRSHPTSHRRSRTLTCLYSGVQGRTAAAPALLRCWAMQMPGQGGGEGEACVTENGARAKRGHKQDGGHTVCTVSPFPLPLPWRLCSQ
nr:serine/arginine repetitive matrix protein 2-like [Loxodonta africana]